MTNPKDGFLFTDIALQMFNTFINSSNNSAKENKVILETLFQSLSDEHGDNPFFMPALIYAFMMHMSIIMKELAESNDTTMKDVSNKYTQHYNKNVREQLAENMSNRPSMHKEILALLEMEEDISGDND